MRARSLLVATAAGMLAAGTAVPAAAETSGETAATVTVEGGVLSITVRSDAGNLGTRSGDGGERTLSGRLGEVFVDDARGATAGSGWVASVVSTDFTSDTGPAIPASAVAYTAGEIEKVGTATLRAEDPVDLTTVTPAVTATRVSGNNSATWNPTVSVTVPGDIPAGVYAATITHSVA
jgi:hypothetical protein